MFGFALFCPQCPWFLAFILSWKLHVGTVASRVRLRFSQVSMMLYISRRNYIFGRFNLTWVPHAAKPSSLSRRTFRRRFDGLCGGGSDAAKRRSLRHRGKPLQTRTTESCSGRAGNSPVVDRVVLFQCFRDTVIQRSA